MLRGPSGLGEVYHIIQINSNDKFDNMMNSTMINSTFDTAAAGNYGGTTPPPAPVVVKKGPSVLTSPAAQDGADVRRSLGTALPQKPITN